MAMAYCSTCRHDVRSWAVHSASAEHKRNLHPIDSRKSHRQNVRRENVRRARHTLTKTWEERMWREQEQRERADRRAEQGPRHYYGPWTPHGLSAFMGGHPGRAVRAVHHAVLHAVGRGKRSTTRRKRSNRAA